MDLTKIEARATQRVTASAGGEAWFNSLSAKQKEQYIKLHPGSKYAKKHVLNTQLKQHKPEFGKDWKKHEKITDHDYHYDQAAKHYKKSAAIHKAIKKDLIKQGHKWPAGRPARGQRVKLTMKEKGQRMVFNEAMGKHPKYKEYEHHEDWATDHENQGMNLEAEAERDNW